MNCPDRRGKVSGVSALRARRTGGKSREDACVRWQPLWLVVRHCYRCIPKAASNGKEESEPSSLLQGEKKLLELWESVFNLLLEQGEGLGGVPKLKYGLNCRARQGAHFV